MRKALLIALVALAAVPAAAAHAHGSIDADILSGSGHRIGFLQGYLRANGHGLATFREATGARATGLIVGLHKRGRSKVRALSKGMRLTLRISHGRVRGKGRLLGAQVRVTGVANEPAPRLRKGMKMLVVGHASGEGYDALRHFFRPVRFNPKKHTRHSFLRERREFHSYGALVFGDVARHRIQTSALLRAFYGAGKWVIVAPATKARQQAIRAVHPYVPGTSAPALAVRATGLRGGTQTVRPTVSYPVAVLPGRAAHLSRVRWFYRQLTSLGAAYMADARDALRPHAAQQSGVNFSLPFNAAAIEVAVPYLHEFTLRGAQNKAQYQQCGWNQSTYNAWCPDTWFWKQQSGGGDATTGCNWFLQNGYDTIDRPTVGSVTTSQNSDGAYHVTFDDFSNAFLQTQGDQCPSDGTQSGSIQGNDYYFAIYEPGADAHTLVVLSDPTISATTSSRLWHDNDPNGTGSIWARDLVNPNRFIPDPRKLFESAWFLGRYTNSVQLTRVPAFDPQIDSDKFEYQSNESFPNNQITFTEDSQSRSTSTSFQVGVFGDQGTASYGTSVTESATTTVSTPDWDVNPTPGSRQITYDWTSSSPISWSTISGGGGGPWGLNKLNKSDFSPASLTVWSGAATCCQVNVASKRVLWLVDHYSRWNGSDVEDRFATTQLQYGDSPNEVFVRTPDSQIGAPTGPGINLCDPAVVAPEFAPKPPGQPTDPGEINCGTLPPVPRLTIQLSCNTLPASTASAGTFSFALNGRTIGSNSTDGTGVGVQPAKTLTCPQGGFVGPLSLAPGADAVLTENVPSSLSVNTYTGCFVGDENSASIHSQVLKSASVPTTTIPAGVLNRGQTISCVIFEKTPAG